MPHPEDRLEAFAGVAYLTLAEDHPMKEAVRESRRLRTENARLMRELADARTAAALAMCQRDEWRQEAEQLLARVEDIATRMGAL